MDAKIFERVLSKKKTRTSETLIATLSGTQRVRQARIGRLSIGPLEYEGLIFEQGKINTLGLLCWSRHLVIFDFPNSKIYLKKGKEFHQVDEADMSGLHLLRISGKTVVHSVDQESPAQQAGIRAGDILINVAGKDAGAYDMWDLRRVLKSQDSRTITMTIERSGDRKELSFLLKRKI